MKRGKSTNEKTSAEKIKKTAEYKRICDFNLKAIKKKKEDFDKRQKEIEESYKVSNWKMKKFVNVGPTMNTNKSRTELINQLKSADNAINSKNFIIKNILDVQKKKIDAK